MQCDPSFKRKRLDDDMETRKEMILDHRSQIPVDGRFADGGFAEKEANDREAC
jgi:hypothetical protein